MKKEFKQRLLPKISVYMHVLLLVESFLQIFLAAEFRLAALAQWLYYERLVGYHSSFHLKNSYQLMQYIASNLCAWTLPYVFDLKKKKKKKKKERKNP